MFKRIDHVEIVPSDMERTIGFYTDVLGFAVKERRKVDRPPLQEVAFLTLNDSTIELLSFADSAPKSAEPRQVGFRCLAIEVEDMDKTVEYLQGKGVSLALGPVMMGSSKRAEIRDPDGISIELRQW